MSRGFDLLEEGEYAAAIEIAGKLEVLRHTAAFDIAAQAHAGLGNVEKAVQTLERGVAVAPGCWLNWQLLGNYRSDLERYDEAAAAYERALACGDTWRDSILLNQSILLCRQGEQGQALALLEKATDPSLHLEIVGSRITALRGLGRSAEALQLAERVLEEQPGDDPNRTALGFIAAEHGRIRLELGADKAVVRKAALGKLVSLGSLSAVLDLIRDIDGEYSPSTKYFRLLLHGSLPAHASPTRKTSNYFVTYDVLAETREEAFTRARFFESRLFPAADLRVEEAEVVEPRPKSPKGVCRWTGRCSYDPEDDA